MQQLKFHAAILHDEHLKGVSTSIHPPKDRNKVRTLVGARRDASGDDLLITPGAFARTLTALHRSGLWGCLLRRFSIACAES
jgi:hypothetical protein